MEQQFIIGFLWVAGFLICFWMLKVEHDAEGEAYTYGDQVLQVILSILSFAMVLFILIKAWTYSVKKYWSKPVKNKKAE